MTRYMYVGVLSTGVSKPTEIIIFRDREFYTEEDQWCIKNVEFCTAVAIISASNHFHVTLFQNLAFILSLQNIRKKN